MKISEGIRKGAKMGPQITGGFGDGKGGTCAMGAFFLGAGLIPPEMLFMQVPSAFLKFVHGEFEQLNLEIQCPLCKNEYLPLANMIPHLNDKHEWSRERIAGWIEAQVETPTYSLLAMQNYMEEVGKDVCRVG